jgi:hypothetical protein
MTTRDRHTLFNGELSDAPGRNESWTEYLRYRGSNRWELIIEGTDFCGVSTAEPLKEKISTKALLKWVLDRDSEDGGGLPVDCDNDDDPPKTFGPRAETLREIAVIEGATFCVSCLDGWLAGAWPPMKQQPVVHILAITGVTRRGVWIRIYNSVFVVDTNLGPAYLYPPGHDRRARLLLKTESSMSPGRMVKVPRALLPQIEALKPAFEALKD